MLLVISPAKTLDYDTPLPAGLQERTAAPKFAARAAALIDVLRDKSAADVAALMDLSPALAQLNVDRYAAWSRRATAKNSRPAAFAFDGDVYDGLDAWTLKAAELDWVQDHVVILSGLYGVLRPLDRLQPYRLEMGTRLATAEADDLYGWWGATIAQYLDRRLAGAPHKVVINLASNEYFRAVDRGALRAPVIECVFEDRKDGRYKIISFYAKKARGLMARWAARHRATTPQALRRFDLDGYAYAADASDDERWVFRRRMSS